MNPIQAIKLFTAVATPSDSTDAFDARIELGRIFVMGLGVGVDEAESEKWYMAALAVAAEDDELAKVEEARSYIARRS